jgi:hypothetical protein
MNVSPPPPVSAPSLLSRFLFTLADTHPASALYILGDKTDRHGLYTVSLDGAPPTTFNGVSGCGGAFAHACEKDNTLAYFATFNDEHEESEHRVTVTNVPGELGAFFGAFVCLDFFFGFYLFYSSIHSSLLGLLCIYPFLPYIYVYSLISSFTLVQFPFPSPLPPHYLQLGVNTSLQISTPSSSPPHPTLPRPTLHAS